MLNTIWGIMHNGRIELSEPVDLPEGARLLVTVLPEEEEEFWLAASRQSLAALWDNAADDAYGRLLEE